MAYRKVNIEGVGEVQFFGNIGAFAEFESETGTDMAKISTDGKIQLSDMYVLIFWAYYVACKRLKKDVTLTREDFKVYLSGKELVDLSLGVFKDIVADMGITEAAEPVSEKKS